MVDMSRKQKKERSTYATVGAEAGVSVKSAFGSDGSALTKGEVQPSEYRDLPFAILFVFNLLFALSVATFRGHLGYVHAVEYLTSLTPYYNDGGGATSFSFTDDLLAEQEKTIIEEEAKINAGSGESDDYYGQGTEKVTTNVDDLGFDEDDYEEEEFEEIMEEMEEMIEEYYVEGNGDEAVGTFIGLDDNLDDEEALEMEEEFLEEFLDIEGSTIGNNQEDYLDILNEEDTNVVAGTGDSSEFIDEGYYDDPLQFEDDEEIMAEIQEEVEEIMEEIYSGEEQLVDDDVDFETNNVDGTVAVDDFINNLLGEAIEEAMEEEIEEEINELDYGGEGVLDDKIDYEIEEGLAAGESIEEIAEEISEEIEEGEVDVDLPWENVVENRANYDDGDDIFIDQDDFDDHDDEAEEDDYYKRHLEEREEWEEELIEEESDIILASLWFPIFISTITGFLFTGCAMILLQVYPQETIQTSLILNVVILVLAGLYSAVGTDDYVNDDINDNSAIIAFMYMFFALVLGWYARAVWHMIPYAGSCLNTGVLACEANRGVFLYSFIAPWIFIIIFVVQLIASIGLLDIGGVFEADYDGNCIGFVSVWLLFSIYWTSQVVKNISTVSVSGTIGTWWFTPRHANSFLSDAVTDSLKRSVTFSFGSICLGSLLTAILQVVVDNLRSMRRQPRLGVFFCIIACLLQYLEHLLEYFNKWAFVYVGLYGYKYMDAGKMAMSLFKSRGWTAIVSHNLVGRCLSLMIFSIGAITLLTDTILIEMILGSSTDYKHIYASLGGAFGQVVGPLIAFACGVSIASATMNVVSSAVDTIVVCFAEAPAEFEENHPELSKTMNDAFTVAWPEFDLALDEEKDSTKRLDSPVV